MNFRHLIAILVVSCLLIAAGIYQYSEHGLTSMVNEIFGLVNLSPNELTLNVHGTKLLKLNNTKEKVKWVSANANIASVNKYGRVFAHHIGETTIYATTKVASYKCHVLVDRSYIHMIDCVGDSITYGTGVVKQRSRYSYPSILDDAFSYNVYVHNYGAPSHTMQKEGDLPYEKTGFLQKVEHDQPDVILLMLGTNDAKDYNWNKMRLIRDYIVFVERLQKLTSHPDVYLMIPPATCMTHRGKATHVVADYVDELPDLITKISQITHTHVIDLYHVTKGHSDYYFDKIHPNALGNQKIVHKIVQTLEKEYYL